MSVFEVRSVVPRGAVAFLQRLRAADTPLDGATCPDKARAWVRRHLLVTWSKRRGSSTVRYEISSAGRRYLDTVDQELPLA